MSVLYCTRPGKIQYRNSRRVSESNGENRLLAGRFRTGSEYLDLPQALASCFACL